MISDYSIIVITLISGIADGDHSSEMRKNESESLRDDNIGTVFYNCNSFVNTVFYNCNSFVNTVFYNCNSFVNTIFYNCNSFVNTIFYNCNI